jgi:hypothetical protein
MVALAFAVTAGAAIAIGVTAGAATPLVLGAIAGEFGAAGVVAAEGVLAVSGVAGAASGAVQIQKTVTELQTHKNFDTGAPLSDDEESWRIGGLPVQFATTALGLIGGAVGASNIGGGGGVSGGGVGALAGGGSLGLKVTVANSVPWAAGMSAVGASSPLISLMMSSGGRGGRGGGGDDEEDRDGKGGGKKTNTRRQKADPGPEDYIGPENYTDPQAEEMLEEIPDPETAPEEYAEYLKNNQYTGKPDYLKPLDPSKVSVSWEEGTLSSGENMPKRAEYETNALQAPAPPGTAKVVLSGGGLHTSGPDGDHLTAEYYTADDKHIGTSHIYPQSKTYHYLRARR